MPGPGEYTNVHRPSNFRTQVVMAKPTETPKVQAKPIDPGPGYYKPLMTPVQKSAPQTKIMLKTIDQIILNMNKIHANSEMMKSQINQSMSSPFTPRKLDDTSPRALTEVNKSV